MVVILQHAEQDRIVTGLQCKHDTDQVVDPDDPSRNRFDPLVARRNRKPDLGREIRREGLDVQDILARCAFEIAAPLA